MRSLLTFVLATVALGASVAACSGEEEDTNAAGSSSGSESPRDVDADDGSDDPLLDAGASSSGQPARDAGERYDAAPYDAGSGGEGSSCAEAIELGSVPGDDEGSALTVRGDCDTWLRVRVVETSTGAIGTQLSAKITLVSPSDNDFDLEVFFDPNVDTLDCSSLQGSSSAPATRSDVVQVAWGEGYVPNNADDSRTLNVHVAGVCGDDQWTLLVEGYR